MTDITAQLAEALRALLATTGQRPVMVAQIRDAEPEAIKAIAAYDAQQSDMTDCGHSKYDPCHNCEPAGDHTAAPWRVSTYAVTSGETGACVMAGEDTVVDLPYGGPWPDAVQDANARRIVACVNACAGIPTADLEGYTARSIARVLGNGAQWMQWHGLMAEKTKGGNKA